VCLTGTFKHLIFSKETTQSIFLLIVPNSLKSQERIAERIEPSPVERTLQNVWIDVVYYGEKGAIDVRKAGSIQLGVKYESGRMIAEGKKPAADLARELGDKEEPALQVVRIDKG